MLRAIKLPGSSRNGALVLNGYQLKITLNVQTHQFYSALERARTLGGFLHDEDGIIISEPSIIAADVAKSCGTCI